MKTIIVSGSFDNLNSRQMRLLQEASRLGSLHVLLWSDDITQAFDGNEPKFPQEERKYLLESIRFVDRVTLVENLMHPDVLSPAISQKADAWVVDSEGDRPARRAYCLANHLDYQVIGQDRLAGFPLVEMSSEETSNRKKVLVTGCYDWLHSGHVRFFEEASQLGDLYVVVGHDANVRDLKGEGHPLFGQDERRYMVHAVRFVKQALITSGWGWMDAEPEIKVIRPDIYVVNEDGDKPEKRAFCKEHKLEYVVLKRLPKEGLPRRESTRLRGF